MRMWNEGRQFQRAGVWAGHRRAVGTNSDGRKRSSDASGTPTVHLTSPDLSLSPEEEDVLPKPSHLPADPLSGWHRRAGLQTICCH